MFRKCLTGLGLTVMLMSTSYAQKVDCHIDSLNRELLAMEEEDQAVRRELMPALAQYQQDGSGKMELITIAMKMENIDQQNQARLKAIFGQCGWPNELSEEAHQAVFLILQHSDDSLMRAHFPRLTDMRDKGYISASDWGTMLDRLLMNEGKPQKYGTQSFADKDNVNLIWPVANADSLEVWRKTIGLPDMETYISIAKDSMQIQMKWDKKLTLEEALKRKEESNL
ncbi:MAG: DUF6624 domain-containing protein [Bacteroidota bacterium]